MPVSRRTAVAATALMPIALAGCGGGADRTKAQVRLVNASGSSPNGYAALDLREEGAVRQAAVGYGGSAGYAEFDPGLDSASIHAGGSPTALLSFTPSLRRDRWFTVLAYGNTGALRQLLLDDNEGEPAAGTARVRVVNAAPDAGALDVYLTASGDPLAQAVPVQSNAAYGSVGAFFNVASGSWRLRVTAAGTGSTTTPDLRLDLDGLVLGNRQVVTIVLTPTRGGTLVSVLWLEQRGGIGVGAGASARVRLVAGVAGATVDAVLGGSTLSGGVVEGLAPYALVPLATNPPAATVRVNGSALAVTVPALDAGADYSLLVHGTAAAPLVAWIADDNRLPTTSGSARVRLVNGVSGTSAPLALKVDSIARAASVASGTASGYATVTATPAADLEVTATGIATPLLVLDDRPLAADAVYTLFAVGTVGAAKGLLSKDR